MLITFNRNKMQCNQSKLIHLVIELCVSLKYFSKTSLNVNHNCRVTSTEFTILYEVNKACVMFLLCLNVEKKYRLRPITNVTHARNCLYMSKTN